jgi:hypothetical protein
MPGTCKRSSPQGRVADVHCGLATVHDLVGVTAGAKHRHAYHIALLLQKASAWHGAWYSAHLKHDQFMQRLRLNRALIQTLSGFVRDCVFEQTGGPGKYNFVTMAVWESAAALDAARQAVYAAYAASGYN